MSDGIQRSDTPYVWPRLFASEPLPVLVYLDLNHWIGLSKAHAGHPDGARYRDFLTVAHAAVDSGGALFPLSSTHYAEMAGISNPRQRADLAAVIEPLSQFRTLLSRVAVMRLELDAALHDLLGHDDYQFAPLELLGHGFGHAFGISGALQIKNRETEVDGAAELRAEWPDGPEAFDQWFAEMEREGQRMMLIGPADDDLPELLAKGFNPAVAKNGQERRARQEREQQAILNEYPQFRRGRTRDLVSVRYLAIELQEALTDAMTFHDLTKDDVLSDRDDFRRLVDCMPTGDVHVTLQTAAHRNAQATWEPNDLFDIDALALAVPYCHAVATDKKWANTLNTTGCAKRFGTFVTSSPDALSAYLKQVIAAQPAAAAPVAR